MYEGKKVYGPYTRKDGRQVVVLKTPGSVHDNQTVSYPKYLVECYLNRYLKENETVDHIDNDFTNNSLSNLRVVDRREHSYSHVLQKPLIAKVCPICGKVFYTRNNTRKLCSSKTCAGKSTHLLGYNKGNCLPTGTNEYISKRSILNNIRSVKEEINKDL